MFSDPAALQQEPQIIEGIERASLRHLTQALLDFRADARTIFAAESDLQADIGEDISRGGLGQSRICQAPSAAFWEDRLQAGVLCLPS